MKIRFFCIACLSVVMFMSTVFAGNIDAPSAPETTQSYTLEDIWKRLNDGTPGSKSNFTEPTEGPGSTGYTLDQVMEEAPSEDTAGAVPADVKAGKTFWGLNKEAGMWGREKIGTATFVRKTGQKKCYNETSEVNCGEAVQGQDGQYEKGDEPPSPRFTVNNGTVTDNLTGLIWMQKANCAQRKWLEALTYVTTIGHGICDLADNSAPGDWRLPNRFELESLLDLGNFDPADPAIPSGHPFMNVQHNTYWSSTTVIKSITNAFNVNMGSGSGGTSGKTSGLWIWPVRGQ